MQRVAYYTTNEVTHITKGMNYPTVIRKLVAQSVFINKTKKLEREIQ